MNATRVRTSKWRLATACMAASIGLLGTSGSAFTQELRGTLKKIDESNSITIGHREASTPFSYYNEKKEPIGFAVDICNRIAEDVKKLLKKPGLQVKYQLVNAQTRIPMVADGTVDLECGSTTNTLTRQQQVDFSAIYFTTGTRILTRKALKAKEIEDLEGKSVGVVGGSTNERAINAMVAAGKLKSVTTVVLKDYAEGAAALEASRVDAFATDDIVLFGLLSKSPIKGDLEVVGRLLTYDPYGIMLRRDDSAFRLVVNRTLAELYRSGEIEKLYARWFDPIGVPLSPLLKAAFELQALPD